MHFKYHSNASFYLLSLEMDMYSPKNPNPSFDDPSESDKLLRISKFLLEDDLCDLGEDQFSYPPSPEVNLPLEEVFSHGDSLLAGELVGGYKSGSKNTSMNVIRNEAKKPQGDDALKPRRVAFKTKTKLDVLDDGYRWRKYGKKAVKNSPNLRNYYKCTSEGCQVKKIVERWVEDSSYLITRYDGVHTHESPTSCYYNNNSHF